MKLSVPITYVLTCEVVNGRAQKTYDVCDAIDVEIPDLSDGDAPEVIRGHFDLGRRGCRGFSRRLHDAALYQTTGDTLQNLSRSVCSSPGRVADFMNGYCYSNIRMFNQGTVEKPPSRIRSTLFSNRAEVITQVQGAFASAVAIGGFIHLKRPVPTSGVTLSGTAFLPVERESRGAIIDIGDFEEGFDVGVRFSFDAARQQRAKEFAELAKELVPSAPIRKNFEAVIERYDVPPSWNEGRSGAYAALNGLADFFSLLHHRRVAAGIRSPLADRSREIARMGSSVIVKNLDPDDALRAGRRFLTALGHPEHRAIRSLETLFSLADFAITESPHDLALISQGDPELANFNF